MFEQNEIQKNLAVWYQLPAMEKLRSSLGRIVGEEDTNFDIKFGAIHALQVFPILILDLLTIGFHSVAFGIYKLLRQEDKDDKHLSEVKNIIKQAKEYLSRQAVCIILLPIDLLIVVCSLAYLAAVEISNITNLFGRKKADNNDVSLLNKASINDMVQIKISGTHDNTDKSSQTNPNDMSRSSGFGRFFSVSHDKKQAPEVSYPAENLINRGL